MMDDHQLLMMQHSFYIPLCEAVHQVLVEEEGNGVVWVSYTGLTTHISLLLTFTHKDLETLIAGGDNNPADLFGADHPLPQGDVGGANLKASLTSSSTHVLLQQGDHLLLPHYPPAQL